jgi:hypothetical protein
MCAGKAKESTRIVEHSKELSSLTNIRLGWKGLQGTNIAAYFVVASFYKEKRFITSMSILRLN